jgi:hypothetical protein
LNENEHKEKENTVRDILSNSEFHVRTHKPPIHRKTTLMKETNPTTHKWVPFTHIGKERTFITNLFKKNQPENCLAHKQHRAKTTNAPTPTPRQIHTLQSIQIDIPGL